MQPKHRNSFWDGKKTLSGTGENAVISIFSFSHNVFKRLLFQGHSKLGLCAKGLATVLFSSAKINSLPNNKFLDWSKLKALNADNKIKVFKQVIFIFDGDENIF